MELQMVHVPKLKSIYIVRHGETEYNVARTATGQINCPINANGIAQAKVLAELMQKVDVKPDTVIHSGLLRAEQTADLLNAQIKAKVSSDHRLQEIMYGDWQGVHFDLIRQAQAEPHEGAPNGETYRGFESRVVSAFTEIASTHDFPLIVCHGGVIKALFGHFKYVIPRPENAVLYRLTADFSTPSLKGCQFELMSQDNNTLVIEKLPLAQVHLPLIY